MPGICQVAKKNKGKKKKISHQSTKVFSALSPTISATLSTLIKLFVPRSPHLSNKVTCTHWQGAQEDYTLRLESPNAGLTGSWHSDNGALL